MCGIIAFSEKIDDYDYNIISYRGPDSTSVSTTNDYTVVFNRLAILDLSDAGNQPFEDDTTLVVCNGEIYNHKELRKITDHEYKSSSDCEVLLPLYKKFKTQLPSMLDAEFALVIFDKQHKEFFAARDPIGIRPLFYGFINGKIAFASEAKALIGYCRDIKPFPPGHFYWLGNFTPYKEIHNIDANVRQGILVNIKNKLIKGVEKRLQSDAEIGFLLSGGLDSSLVCSIASRFYNKPITTFSTGINTDPIDTKYARTVAAHIGSIHHEYLFTKNDVLSNIEKVIWTLESWDTTTIRASIGMYLLCKYIKENTSIKVLLTGEISDELFGYKYTDFAPSSEEFQQESKKRVLELHMYDVLRADRCVSSNSLEARVPFGDLDFAQYVMSIDPVMKMKQQGKMGKFLLRKAFDVSSEEKPWLPNEILWREKAAFSDAVGHSMVDYIKEYAEQKISDSDLEQIKNKHSYCPPLTKEAALYRQIFVSLFGDNEKLIKDFWMPNKNWPNCNVNDPSARVLINYGNSGS